MLAPRPLRAKSPLVLTLRTHLEGYVKPINNSLYGFINNIIVEIF